MKNPLKLVLLLLCLSPSFLPAQPLAEGDATYTVTDSVLGFRVKVPVKKVFLLPSNYDKQIRAKVYSGVDSTENTRYVFGFSAFVPGSFLMDDSSYYSGLRTGFEALFSQLYRDTAYMMNGCFVEDLYGIRKAGDRLLEYRHIGRGNSWYMLLADFPLQRSAPTAKMRAFFDSFSILDYPVRDWHRSVAPDSSLTTWAPTPLFLHREDSSDNLPKQSRYLAFDSLHFNSYFISHLQIPAYYWSRSDSALYAGIIAIRILPTDSLVYKRPVRNGDATGWEWMRKPRNGMMYERERALLNGDQVYFLTTYVSGNDAASPNTNRFFDDFRFARPMRKTHVFDSKAAALLDDLFAPDPARAAAALAYMPKAPFDKDDLSLLHSSMLKMPAYQGNHNNYHVKAVLTNHIIHIHDTISYRWAKEHYKTLSAPSDYEKGFLIDIMASFPSSAHYSAIGALMHASPPRALPIDLLLALGKHLHLTARIMPELLALPCDSSLRFFIIDLAGKLADSNLLPATALLPYRHELLRLAAGRIAYLSTDYGSPRTTDDALISLLGLLNTDSSNAVLREYLDMEFHDERIKAFAALLRNGKQRAEDIRNLAGDKSTRLDLYHVLEKAGRLPLFPMTFRTQKMFSESAVYAATMEFELEPPAAIDFLDMESTRTGAGSKTFFFYRIKSENGLTHLACAGPYGQDPGQTGSLPATAIYDYRHSYDPAHAEEQKSGLLTKIAGR